MSLEDGRFRGVTNNGSKVEREESLLDRLARVHGSSAPIPQSNFLGQTEVTASDLQALRGDGRVGATDASPAQIARVIKGESSDASNEHDLVDVYEHFLQSEQSDQGDS